MSNLYLSCLLLSSLSKSLLWMFFVSSNSPSSNVPIWHKTNTLKCLSLEWPLTIIASDVEVSEFDLFLVSSDNKAPTTSSNSRVSDELRLIEVTKWCHDSGNEHNKVTAFSYDSNFTFILSNCTGRVIKVFRWSVIVVPSFTRKMYHCRFRKILLVKDFVMYSFSSFVHKPTAVFF